MNQQVIFFSFFNVASDIQTSTFYVSKNNGNNWTIQNIDSLFLNLLNIPWFITSSCCSYTGQYIYFYIADKDIDPTQSWFIYSSDYGDTWNKSKPNFIDFLGNYGYINTLSCTPDGKYVYGGGEPNLVVKSNDYGQNWFMIPYETNYSRTSQIHNHSSSITTLDWNNSTTRIITGSTDTTVKVWDYDPVSSQPPDLVDTKNNSKSQVYDVDYNDANTYFASASWLNQIDIFSNP
jgi:WD40 repeat protein